jgi:rod shape-determining protein MreC
VPRNRTAKVAVLGSAAQRSQTAQYSRSTGPVRRRVVVAVLVVLSLVLITVYFRESSGGALHGAQSAGATVLRPFEVATQRVARPFEDAYGYVSGLLHAKSEVKRLRAENTRLRNEVTINAYAASQNAYLRKTLHYLDSPHFPEDYTPITTQVLSTLAPAYGRVITIDAGKANGVRLWSPVTVAQGLVGQVTGVTRYTAQVTLLVDATSNVAARDVSTHPGATGLVRHAGSGDQLILDRVQKTLEVRKGDTIVTAGSPQGKLPSVYPAGIPIGRVTSVSQNDVDIYKQIQVQPFVDFSSLESVVVLSPKHPTPGLP